MALMLTCVKPSTRMMTTITFDTDQYLEYSPINYMVISLTFCLVYTDLVC